MGWRQIAVPKTCHAPIRGVTMLLIPDIFNGDSYRMQKEWKRSKVIKASPFRLQECGNSLQSNREQIYSLFAPLDLAYFVNRERVRPALRR